jgi:protein CMS1
MALDSSDVETAAGAAAPRKVESSQSSSNQKRTAKRKRTVDETAEPAKARRRKRQAVDDEDVDYEKGIRLSYAGMDNNLLADHVAQRTQKHQSDLSTVELEDRRISAGSIRDSSSFALPRTLDNLPTYLEDFAGNTKKLWSASKKNGAPHTIVVTGAGLRAAELARYVTRNNMIWQHAHCS